MKFVKKTTNQLESNFKVFNGHLQQYVSYIMAVSSIGGGN